MPIDFAPTQTFFFGTFPMVRNPNKISPIHEKGKKKKETARNWRVQHTTIYCIFALCNRGQR